MIWGDRHNTMRRLILSIFSALLLFGCPGGLNNPEDFTGGGNIGGSTGRTVEAVFEESCGIAGCHAPPAPAAGLDLVSADVASRTVGVSSSNPDCASDITVVPGDPDESYMLRKILNDPGICGGQMPVLTILDAEDTDVVRQWIMSLAAAPGMINEGPDGGI